jgi:hypothetical protein
MGSLQNANLHLTVGEALTQINARRTDSVAAVQQAPGNPDLFVCHRGLIALAVPNPKN